MLLQIGAKNNMYDEMDVSDLLDQIWTDASPTAKSRKQEIYHFCTTLMYFQCFKFLL